MKNKIIKFLLVGAILAVDIGVSTSIFAGGNNSEISALLRNNVADPSLSLCISYYPTTECSKVGKKSNSIPIVTGVMGETPYVTVTVGTQALYYLQEAGSSTSCQKGGYVSGTDSYQSFSIPLKNLTPGNYVFSADFMKLSNPQNPTGDYYAIDIANCRLTKQ